VGWNAVGLDLQQTGVQGGILSGTKLAGVNGRVYSRDLLNHAIKAGKNNFRPIQPLVVADDYDQTRTVNYRDDQRYPHSGRDASKPYLDELLKPLTRQD
jgi:hypothetical protein